MKNKTVKTGIRIVDTLGLSLLVLLTGLWHNGAMLRWLMCFCVVFSIAEIVAVMVHQMRTDFSDVNATLSEMHELDRHIPWYSTMTEIVILVLTSVVLFLTRASGRQLILCVGAAVATDASGLMFGKFFRKTKLGKTVKMLKYISPNKTYMGYVGEFIGGYAVMALIVYVLDINLSWQILVFYFAAPIIGALGDISASLCKRSIHIKDSNSALKNVPIVGKVEWLTKSRNGFLDMFDSIAFDLLFLSLLLI